MIFRPSIRKAALSFRLGTLTSLCFLALTLCACDKPVPEGRIRVKNDCQDSEYNTIKVSGGGLGASLKPGETVLMPKGTTTISFSRAYKSYTRVYKVQCPQMKPEDSGFQIKMIDAHTNRMKGGCKTVFASKG